MVNIVLPKFLVANSCQVFLCTGGTSPSRYNNNNNGKDNNGDSNNDNSYPPLSGNTRSTVPLQLCFVISNAASIHFFSLQCTFGHTRPLYIM